MPLSMFKPSNISCFTNLFCHIGHSNNREKTPTAYHDIIVGIAYLNCSQLEENCSKKKCMLYKQTNVISNMKS